MTQIKIKTMTKSAIEMAKIGMNNLAHQSKFETLFVNSVNKCSIESKILKFFILMANVKKKTYAIQGHGKSILKKICLINFKKIKIKPVKKPIFFSKKKIKFRNFLWKKLTKQICNFLNPGLFGVEKNMIFQIFSRINFWFPSIPLLNLHS